MLDRRKQIEELLESFNAVRRIFLRHRDSYLKQSGLTYSQALVLRMVAEHDGMSIKEIASLLGITSSATTQMVDTLVKKGHLVREESPEDRRALKIKLSEDGKKQITAFKTQALEKLFDTFSDEELLQYCELNRKILSKIMGK